MVSPCPKPPCGDQARNEEPIIVDATTPRSRLGSAVAKGSDGESERPPTTPWSDEVGHRRFYSPKSTTPDAGSTRPRAPRTASRNGAAAAGRVVEDTNPRAPHARVATPAAPREPAILPPSLRRGTRTDGGDGTRSAASAGSARHAPATPGARRAELAGTGARRRHAHAAPDAAPATRRRAVARERGLPAWGALGVLVLIAGGAGLIDLARGPSSQGAYNVGVIVAALVAIVVVKHSQMFPVVVAPPLVFVAGKACAALLRHQDLLSRRGLIDIATNWFVFGFPAIAAATAAVAIVAGIRMIIAK